MAGELRIMENKSREDINLSPSKFIHFSIHLAPIASNYQQSYPN
ncbi:putative dithiol-disulfide isomerase [Staphylococcus aureus]|nr:putative dithiol-disulfide isomerase [Staphylococcus aureus]